MGQKCKKCYSKKKKYLSYSYTVSNALKLKVKNVVRFTNFLFIHKKQNCYKFTTTFTGTHIPSIFFPVYKNQARAHVESGLGLRFNWAEPFSPLRDTYK